MTFAPDTLLAIWIAALVIAAWSALGAKVLREFSAGELEEYCLRRKRLDFFGDVLDHYERLAEGAESLQLAATTAAIIGGVFWSQATGRLPDPLDWTSVGLLFGAATVGLLAVTHWIPLAVVKFWSAPFLYHTWRIWLVIGFFVWPFSIGVNFVGQLSRRLAGRHAEEDDEEEAFEDEILSMVSAGEREGLLEADARDMIEGVMELSDDDVSDIMTSRTDIDAIQVDMPWDEMVAFVTEVGRTRIPVYEETLDNIVGILYAKDLLPVLADPDHSARSLPAILREAWKIPATKHLDELLQEFRNTRVHMAIVIDEYGSTAGVVTIEDVLEEIVGDIIDETDDEEDDEIQVVDERTSVVDGRTHLDDINERLGLNLAETNDFDTIAGLVMEQLGRIPMVGESITIEQVRVTVLEASRRRVEKVRLELIDEMQREQV
ncbi:hemolysin family protein [Lignipirellula cremea]|uniref:Magnesium and cobalt efflux protein CorC n=1 Tax=Lignipirellula cremea TaxID=2528010 RepID=A0A518E256_9BACT|nr:hemolysin family protein [Lignipirellula cremea]QDU98142.1 Magnesium and cobalt efflux protein CorC [Lignipirellula cremea]